MKTQRVTSKDTVVHIFDFMSDIIIHSGMEILEPSAGSGNLIKHLIDHIDNPSVLNKDNFHCIELNTEKREELKKGGYRLIGADFMDYNDSDISFDLAIACPPFKNGIDTTHIMKMYDLVKVGGNIVTLTQPRWMFDNVSESIEFRKFLENKNYSIKMLPDNSFIEKGKTVPTAILIINK